MPKVELSVGSLICILLSAQSIVSLFVIGTITYMNQTKIVPDPYQADWEGNNAPAIGNYQLLIQNGRGSGHPSHKQTDKNRSLQQNLQEFKDIMNSEIEKRTLRQNHVPVKTASTSKSVASNPVENPPMSKTAAAPPGNDFVILTTVNAEFVDIAENWLESVRRLGIRYNITVVAEDKDTYQYFSIRSNEEFRVLFQKQYAFNFTRRYGKTMMFQELIRRRTVYIRTLLEQGRDVLLVDVDTVWMKNPVDLILNEYTDYDLWHGQGFVNHMPCPCFMYMKAVPRVIEMVREWVKRLENHEGSKLESDQVALSHVLPLFPNIPTKKLSFERFPTGKHFFDPDWLAQHRDEVYVAHGNHLGRHDGKKEKFKEFGIWLLNS